MKHFFSTESDTILNPKCDCVIALLLHVWTIIGLAQPRNQLAILAEVLHGFPLNENNGTFPSTDQDSFLLKFFQSIFHNAHVL